MDSDITPFRKLINDRTGISFNALQIERLRKVIDETMLKTGITSYPHFFGLLINDNKTFDGLVDLLTVNETYFFREPVHFKLVTDFLAPEIMVNKKGQKINMLSAGCSTGEELYSLATALWEKYEHSTQHLFSFRGFDIDTKAIKTAQTGIFNERSFRSTPDHIKHAYFTPADGNNLRIKNFIKDVVGFQQHNLLHTPYPECLNQADIIFYRNVSIYFERENQKKIFQNLANILNDNGYLIVSAPETLAHDLNILPMIEINGIFLYYKNFKVLKKKECIPPYITTVVSNPEVARFQFDKNIKPAKKIWRKLKSDCAETDPDQTKKPKISAKRKSSTSHPKRTTPEKKSTAALFDEAREFVKNKKYDTAIEKIDKLIAKDGASAKAHTLKAGIFINIKKIRDAIDLCRKAIDIDPFWLESYILLGTCLKISERRQESIESFKKALYIDTSSWLSHFYLAEIYKEINETDKACREYDIVINLIEKKGVTDHGLTYFPIKFSIDEILRLSRHNMETLRRRGHSGI